MVDRQFTVPILLSQDPTLGLHAATKQYTDTADALKAPLASPTFTGTVTVPYPSNFTDASNKQYTVDLVAVNNGSGFIPNDHGMSSWTGDPIDASTTYQPPASGNFFATAIKVDYTFTCGTIYYMVQTAGATFTASRNYLGLYSTAGALLRQTADQSTGWTTAGTKGTAWSAGSISLSPGVYYIGGITTATTRPIFAAKPTLNGAGSGVGSYPAAIGRTTGTYRTFLSTGTNTALPSTLPAPNAFINAVWFGLGS